MRVADQHASALLQEPARGRSPDALTGRRGDHGGASLQQPVTGHIGRTLDACHGPTLTYQTLVREAAFEGCRRGPRPLPRRRGLPRRGPVLARRARTDGPAPSLETEEGFAAHRAWEAELAADRWSVVSWPTAYGGRDAGLVRWLIFEEEYYAAGAPGRVGQNGINLLAPTLFDHGTEEQRARVLPAMATGEVIWAQAWSEPEAGSDLASLTSGPCARRGAGCCAAGRHGRRGRPSPTVLSGCSAAIRGPRRPIRVSSTSCSTCAHRG